MPFRHALRFFTKCPGIAALAVLSLAAGIGLTAVLGSLADAILFRPLPVALPGEMVGIYTASPGQPFGFVSYPDYQNLRDASRTLGGVVAQRQVLLAIGGGDGKPARVRMGLAVTPNYFDVLGVPAALGRTFHAGESEPVVIIAGGKIAGAAIGGSIRIGGTLFTVIGVAPKDFGLDRFMHEDFYIPMGVYEAGLLPAAGRPLEDRSKRYLTVYGRLAPGTSLQSAQAELSAIAARLELEYPETNKGRRALVLTELASRMRSGRTMPSLVAILIAVAALVLAIGCANAAGLLLLRGETRAHELAVRLAMGSSQGRLLRGLLTESLILAAAGVATGLPLAWAATRVLTRWVTLPTDLPMAIAPRVDGRVAALALGATALAAVVCAIAPWIATRRVETSAMLRRKNSSSRGSLRNVLAATEIALAVTLVASGGLLLESLTAAGKIDLGYRLDHVLVMAFDPEQVRKGEAQTRAFYDRVLERVQRLPGVRAAALAQSTPLGFTGAQSQITIAGDEIATATEQDRFTIWMNTVSPGYFELMHMRIVAGRGFDERDTETSPPVMVINQELARFWKNGEAMGRRILMQGRQLQVIGVARTAKYFQVGEAPRPYFYLPYSQNFASRMVLHVEIAGEKAAGAAVLGEMRGIDANQPVSEVRMLEDYFSQGGLFGIRVGLDIVGAVGTCGLLLALAGLYSVIASAVERRRREIAIRLAVGASRPAVVVLVLGQAIKLVAVGATAGLGLALPARWLLASLLPGSAAEDWRVLAVSTLIVIAASLAACLVPAWRASGIDPAVALQQD